MNRKSARRGTASKVEYAKSLFVFHEIFKVKILYWLPFSNKNMYDLKFVPEKKPTKKSVYPHFGWIWTSTIKNIYFIVQISYRPRYRKQK